MIVEPRHCFIPNMCVYFQESSEDTKRNNTSNDSNKFTFAIYSSLTKYISFILIMHWKLEIVKPYFCRYCIMHDSNGFLKLILINSFGSIKWQSPIKLQYTVFAIGLIFIFIKLYLIFVQINAIVPIDKTIRKMSHYDWFWLNYKNSAIFCK